MVPDGFLLVPDGFLLVPDRFCLCLYPEPNETENSHIMKIPIFENPHMGILKYGDFSPYMGKNPHIWVSFPRTGILAKMCPFLKKSRALV